MFKVTWVLTIGSVGLSLRRMWWDVWLNDTVYLEVVAGMLMESTWRGAFETCRCCDRKDWPGDNMEELPPPRRDSMANFWKLRLWGQRKMYFQRMPNVSFVIKGPISIDIFVILPCYTKLWQSASPHILSAWPAHIDARRQINQTSVRFENSPIKTFWMSIL